MMNSKNLVVKNLTLKKRVNEKRLKAIGIIYTK